MLTQRVQVLHIKCMKQTHVVQLCICVVNTVLHAILMCLL